MTSFDIEEATNSDQPFLRVMLEEVALSTYPELRSLGRISCRERLDEIFDFHNGQEQKRIWVARSREKMPLGMIWLIPSHHPVSEQPDYLILNLAVVEAHRHQGIARALMACAQAFCKAANIHALRLFVGAHNTAALALYQRLGFEEQTREMRLRF
jgi:ribosomal protein S18 acetylase RimI-like enzyme